MFRDSMSLHLYFQCFCCTDCMEMHVVVCFAQVCMCVRQRGLWTMNFPVTALSIPPWIFSLDPLCVCAFMCFCMHTSHWHICLCTLSCFLLTVSMLFVVCSISVYVRQIPQDSGLYRCPLDCPYGSFSMAACSAALTCSKDLFAIQLRLFICAADTSCEWPDVFKTRFNLIELRVN